MTLHTAFNFGIAAAYFLIPLGLFSIVIQAWRSLTPLFRLSILKFCLFILACATEYLLEGLGTAASIITIAHAFTFTISIAVALQMPTIGRQVIQFIERSQQLHQQVRENEARFEAFLNCPKLVAFMKDESLKIVYVNQTLINIFGDLTGSRDRERDPAVGSSTEANDRQVLETGEPYEYVELVPSKDGKPRQWLSYKFPIAIGNQRYVGGVTIEVTEREQLREELERSNAELEQFAYAASHDLRTPLRGISGLIAILSKRLSDRLDEREQALMQQINRDCSYATELVNGILAYSRIGRQQTALEAADINLLLTDVCDRLHPLLEEHQAVVIWEQMPRVQADPTQLTQVFENLLTNAVKYRSPKPPHIIFTIEPQPNHWLFAVQDNGIGIESEYHEQVFAMFSRLHGRGEIEGTGIGLAIVRKVAQRHEGNAWVESDGAGCGSTFKFSIRR